MFGFGRTLKSQVVEFVDLLGKLYDVNLTRSGSFDTGYGDLDDATSSEVR